LWAGTGFLAAETFRFSSDTLRTDVSEGTERVQLSGNVVIESEKREIRADLVDLWGEDYRYFSGSGQVYIHDLEQDIILESESFTYDKETDVMRLVGQVVMQDYENELVIKCQYLELRGEEDKVILQIGVRILQDDIVCRSEFAEYYRDTELLELSGLPVVYKGDDPISSRSRWIPMRSPWKARFPDP
jgi:lipopolysaccharide export system protein LptA